MLYLNSAFHLLFHWLDANHSSLCVKVEHQVTTVAQRETVDCSDVESNLTGSLSDSLGEGSLDLDTIIMALYLIRYNRPGCFVTPEPLGPGGDPYPAMNNIPDTNLLDHMVQQTASYFREREEAVLSL